MVSRLAMAMSAVLLGAGLPASPAHAQTRSTFSVVPQGRDARPGGGRGIERRPDGDEGPGRARPGRGGVRGTVILPPYYYYPYAGYVGTRPQPKPPAKQPSRPAVAHPAPPAAPPQPPVESLLLEYRGGKWIRVPTGNKVPNGTLAMQPESEAAPSTAPPATSGAPAPQPQPPARPAELVFRDGHRETIQKYVIHGNAIYASVDYWKSGTWTKKILLSDLNVPATLKLNQERGVKFSLPSGPSQVIVGF